MSAKKAAPVLSPQPPRTPAVMERVLLRRMAGEPPVAGLVLMTYGGEPHRCNVGLVHPHTGQMTVVADVPYAPPAADMAGTWHLPDEVTP